MAGFVHLLTCVHNWINKYYSVVYKKATLPCFDYVTLITDSSVQSTIKRLQVLQNTVIHRMSGVLGSKLNDYVSTQIR